MTYEIELVTLNPQPALVIEADIAPEEVGDTLARIFPTVFGHIHAQGGEMAGMPFLR